MLISERTFRTITAGMIKEGISFSVHYNQKDKQQKASNNKPGKIDTFWVNR